MKRIIAAIAAAALLGQAALVFAQDDDGPSLKSVLEAARAKYWHFIDPGKDEAPKAADAPEADASPDGQASDDQAPAPDAPALAPDGDSARADGARFSPFVLSLAPGVSFPRGYRDCAVGVGVVGSLVRDVSGVEGASIFTISRDVRGASGAGIFNISRNVRGVQAAGVFNLADESVSGIQAAGVFNIARGTVSGPQAAGVFNIAGKVRSPLQGAGVFNLAGEIDGFQAAGVINVAGTVKGGQAAGVFNKAGHVAGVQVGLVNIADDIEGVQLGLLNIAGNGVDSVGLDYQASTGYLYSSLQTGTPMLYTLWTLGAPSDDWMRDFRGFVGGFGLGTRTRLMGLNLDFDVSAEAPIGALPLDSGSASKAKAEKEWSAFGRSIRAYPSARLTLGLPIGKQVQIVGGLKADIDLDCLGNRVPEGLKAGDPWSGELFGEGFTVWPKWFIGFKI